MGCGQSSEAYPLEQTDRNTGDYHPVLKQPAVFTYDQRDQTLPAAVIDPNQNENLQKSIFNAMYSIREISDHNAQKQFCELFPWKRSVHYTDIFKEDIKADFLEMENEVYGSDEYYHKLNYSEKWGTTPIGVLMKRGLKYIKIKNCLGNSKVADLRVYNDKEYSDDISTDAMAVENDLKNDSNITFYQTEYLAVLQRFFHRLNKNLGIIQIHSTVPNGDPNLASFPLPDTVAEDPTVLREWIVDWILFDTEVSYDNPWNCAWTYVEPSEPVIDDLLPTDDLYRKEFHSNLEVFNFEIDGKVAWKVLSQDIVKNDTTTPDQDAILEQREKRTDLNDPGRMLKRRQEIANYFITERADGLQTYCDDFMGFAENLEKAWKEFQDLCQKE